LPAPAPTPSRDPLWLLAILMVVGGGGAMLYGALAFRASSPELPDEEGAE
jgi:hypothetical protein